MSSVAPAPGEKSGKSRQAGIRDLNRRHRRASFRRGRVTQFQFIQDPIEYETRTHHSNMDAYDRAQPADLIQASAIVAAFVYHAANREERFPRKPLPEPQPLQKPSR